MEDTYFSSSSSDEESSKLRSLALKCMCSRLKKKRKPRRAYEYKRNYIERNREQGHEQLYNDYFSPQSTYPDHLFRRRFRMRKEVFLRLVAGVMENERFFQPNPDASGRLSISSLQKCTAAIRMMAYGESSDRVDEYLRLSDSTTRMSLKHFTSAVIAQFGDEYLRSPTEDDLRRILQINEARGFPGMISSIDCMHWEWKNCPTAWKGSYQGRSGRATVILEAVATQDLWIWHSFFGIPGSCNDINVLHRSPIFDDVLNGRAPRVEYTVNGHKYNTAYYLTDGIYPSWSTFIKSFPHPQTPKEQTFATAQESTRKDVERAFGVLQARFAIIRKPALSWKKSMLEKIMQTCIILHNMIVENERESYANYKDPSEYNVNEDEDSQTSVQAAEHGTGYKVDIFSYVVNQAALENKEDNKALTKDLIEHIWERARHNHERRKDEVED